jgi:cyclopropane fatty-acyl-phospholipid synthase-like methyltransferase
MASITRNFTSEWLIENINMHCKKNLKIAEFGGGNSCFHDAIMSDCSVDSYTIFDNNQLSINLFNDKYKHCEKSLGVQCDLLLADFTEEYDLVFSVGLVEHFDTMGTSTIIKKHFQAVKKGGIVIITAPTPTFLYRFIRKFAEVLGIWKFPDERPITKREMYNNVLKLGSVLKEKTLWILGLTQLALVIKKDR